MFVKDQTLFVSPIQEDCFEEVKQYAEEALKKAEPVGDDPDVSTREEYKMKIPRKFEAWITELIDLYFHHHTHVKGFYGLDNKNLKISSIWVNRMLKGDQHKPHSHEECLYAFVVYVKTTDNDAGFCWMTHDGLGGIDICTIDIDEVSMGHVMIFPADLPHTVYPKMTDDERISVSGNICCYTK